MKIRVALPSDAEGVAAIYTPIVRDTFISFELVPPSIEEVRSRITSTTERLPWLVALGELDAVTGYAYASKHRERSAYQWSVDTTVYVAAKVRGGGIGRRLYNSLFEELATLGYFQAFAGIALPNEASVAFHEALGFEAIGVYKNVGYKCGSWRDVGWWQKPLRALDTPRDLLPFLGGSGE